MKRKLFLLIAISLLILFVVGCTQKTEKTNSDTLHIYTTIFPLEDFAKKIGGEYVKVESILPPGTDGHTFEPTTKVMTDIADSDAFIYSGSGIEGFADKVEEILKNSDVKIIKAAKGIELLANKEMHNHDHKDTSEDSHSHEGENGHTKDEGEGHVHGGNGGLSDPHVWIDPIRSIQLAENIKNALVELKPDKKDYFEENFQKLKEELQNLDKEFKELIEKAPRKEIIVAHAAYGYWEERYGIKQLSITGLSPTEEPSQKQLTKIIDQAKKYHLKYIIFEENVTPKIAEIIKNELKAKSLVLHNLETITEKDRNANEDYFSLMRKNLETLKTALSK